MKKPLRILIASLAALLVAPAASTAQDAPSSEASHEVTDANAPRVDWSQRRNISTLLPPPGYYDNHRLAVTFALSLASRHETSATNDVFAGAEARYFFNRELAVIASYAEQLPFALDEVTRPVSRRVGGRLTYTCLRGKAALFRTSFIRFDLYGALGAGVVWMSEDTRRDIAPEAGLGMRIDLTGDFILDLEGRTRLHHPLSSREQTTLWMLGVTYRLGEPDHTQHTY